MDWICALLGLTVALFFFYHVIKGVLTPRTCGLCGAKLAKTIYKVEVNGSKYTACANCGRRLANHASKQAVDRVLGK